MPHIFRLRYYLRRSGEKQPLLLLQPLASTGNNEEICYLYSEGGGCKTIELRKLHALCRSGAALQQLARELRDSLQHTQPRNSHDLLGLQAELETLWLGSVKGIAMRELAQGQILTPEGVWLVSERSFYALVPRQLAELGAEQAVTLQEGHESGASYLGLLAALEEFHNTAGDPLTLCRLRLKQRTFISMTQALPKQQSLYQLQLAGQEFPVFLFAPVSAVESSFALRKFLHGQQQQISAGDWLDDLQNLATQFIGWGGAPATPPETSSADTLASLGSWQLRQDLLQKYTKHLYQRACQFGGYPIETLLQDLSGHLPQALLKSLLAYLCGTGSTTGDYYASCQKIDGHLLAEKGMHPELHRRPPSPTEEETPSQEALPPPISPPGQQLLQELQAAGEEGLFLHQFPRKQAAVLQALLRSGWAQRSHNRCYARTASRKEKKDKTAAEKIGGTEDLTTILAKYKKKYNGKFENHSGQHNENDLRKQFGRYHPPSRQTNGRSQFPQRAKYPRSEQDYSDNSARSAKHDHSPGRSRSPGDFELSRHKPDPRRPSRYHPPPAGQSETNRPAKFPQQTEYRRPERGYSENSPRSAKRYEKTNRSNKPPSLDRSRKPTKGY